MTQVVSVKFSIASGSRAESLEEKGAAQLLAATAFIGTAKRSGIRLVRDLENLGAKFSAVADREQVIFCADSYLGKVNRRVD